MMKTHWTWGVLVSGCLLAGSAGAQLDLLEWNGDAADGDFGNAANWQVDEVTLAANPPGTTDGGIFNTGAASAYTVTLDQARDVGALQVQTDKLALDLGGYAMGLLTAGDPAIPYALSVAVNDNEAADLTLQGGTTMSAASMRVADGSGAAGSLTVTGSSTRLEIDSLVDAGVNGGTATILLDNNGYLKVTDSHFYVRNDSTMTVKGGATYSGTGNTFFRLYNEAVLTIEAGSTVTGNRWVEIHDASAVIVDGGTLSPGWSMQFGSGSGDDASLQVLNGGLASGPFKLELGAQHSNATGTAEIRGSAGETPSRLTAGHGYIGGGENSEATGGEGTGLLIVADGASATFSNDFFLFGKGTLEVDAGAVEMQRHVSLYPTFVTLFV